MDSYACTYQCWLTSKNLHSSVLVDTAYYLEELPRLMTHRHDVYRESGESVLLACHDDNDGDDEKIDTAKKKKIG